MEQEKRITAPEEAEISFNKIIQRAKVTGRFLLRKWYILLLAFVMGGGLGWLYCFMTGKTYISNCTYTVQGQSASSSLLSSAISLASSLGISAKGGGPSSYDNNFFANLMQSRRIVKETLLQKDKVDGREDILANHYIKINNLDEDWRGEARLENFKFIHDDVRALNRLEDSVLNNIFDVIIKDYLDVNYEAENPFNTASFVSSNYDFSKCMMKRLLSNTSSYYLREMYSLNNANLTLAEKRVDSLANAIRDLDAKVAYLKDNSNNVIKQSGLVQLNAAIRDQSLLNIQYSSAVNNYELAKVSMMTQTPVLDVIDDPVFSTETIIPPIVLAIVGGSIGFFVLAAGFLIVVRFVRATVEEEKLQEEKQ